MWQAVTKVSRAEVKCQACKSNVLASAFIFPGVLGGNAGFNPAVLGFWLGVHNGEPSGLPLLSQQEEPLSDYLL